MVKPAFSFLPQHGLFEVKDGREDAIFSNEEMQFIIGFIENFPYCEGIVLGKSPLLQLLQERFNRLGIDQRFRHWDQAIVTIGR